MTSLSSKPRQRLRRSQSVETREPTNAQPSLRFASELDGVTSDQLTSTVHPNADKWHALLTSVGVSVPSPELAESLKSTTYVHSIAEDGEHQGCIEFRNPMDAAAPTHSKGSLSTDKIPISVVPQPVSKEASSVFMKWTSSYNEHDTKSSTTTGTTDRSAAATTSTTTSATSTTSTTATTATSATTATTATTTTSKAEKTKTRKRYFVRSVLSKLNSNSRRKENATKLIRAGIPPDMRGTVWELCCGSRKKCHLAASNGEMCYSELVKSAMESLGTRQKNQKNIFFFFFKLFSIVVTCFC